jgi:NAD+ synthase
MARSRPVLGLRHPAAEREIVAFIRRVVKDSGAKGVVLGLSGGVDSAVVGALCVKALGKERVTVLLLPSEFTPAADVEDAKALASEWGVRTYLVNISLLVEAISGAVGIEQGKIPKANVQARVRMVLDYYVANTYGLLVAGTGDKSEDLLGYFTKFGDGGADFMPIAHLYKTQVRELGRKLGLPESICSKPASPRLWSGHTAAEELPADYDKLDPLLFYLFEAKLSPAAAVRKAGVGMDLAKAVLRLNKSSSHKRTLPPMVKQW